MEKTRLSNKSIRKAGENLRQNIAVKDDLDIISTFRTAHIQIMKMLVKTIKDKLPKPLLIARRLKRLSSIKAKLKRFENMQLDRMQDIGGVRAVFKNTNEVMAFAENIKRIYGSNKSVLNIVKEFDYIKEPKSDGYRSYHLVFEYTGKIDEIKNYKIELQLRDLLQHYWATAIEILALKSDTNIKAGKIGNEDYKRFFWCCAELFAGSAEYNDEIKKLDEKLNILMLLSGLNVASDIIDKKGDEDSLYLLILNVKDEVLKLTRFDKKDKNTAQQIYQTMETNSDISSVLVSVDDIKKLKKAYPNYFLNAKNFIKEVRDRLGFKFL